MSVLKSAPPTLCSCARQTFATKSVPAANTKSAPKTARTVAGKPKAQYGAAGSITAKSRFATAVNVVPIPTVDRSEWAELHGRRERYR